LQTTRWQPSLGEGCRDLSVGRLGHYYTQRLQVALLRVESQRLRFYSALEPAPAQSDPSLQGDAARIESLARSPPFVHVGLADLSSVYLPSLS
jgi:hypothetical protein